MEPIPKYAAMVEHVAASVAPRPTLNRKRRLPSPVKQPSAATNPPMKSARSSVAGGTVIVTPAQPAAAHWQVAPGFGTSARTLSPLARVQPLVLDQCIAPPLVLRSLRGRQQVTLHERDRRIEVRPTGIDRVHASRQPVFSFGRRRSDRSEAEMLAERFEHRAITARNRNLEQEPPPRRAVLVGLPER